MVAEAAGNHGGNWHNVGADPPLPALGANDTQTFGRFGTSGSVNDRLMSCPPGHYIYQLRGRAGSAVDQINGLGCRNIITGQTVNGDSPGPLGTSGGGSAIDLTSNNNDGAAGFYVRAGSEVEHLRPSWRGASAKSCCGAGQYDDDAAFGPPNGGNWWKYWCDSDHLVNSISGGASGNNGRLTNFSFSCRNFSNMAAIGNSPTACCLGTDTSQDCQDVKQYLSCPAVVSAYCRTGNNMGQPSCQTYYKGDINNQEYRSNMIAYCKAGDNWQTDLCKNYCTFSNSASTPAKGECDDLYRSKCDPSVSASDASLPICSCLQPWVSYPGHGTIDKIPGAPQRPSCYFSDCIQNGYKPQVDVSQQCPACVQSQTITVENSTADINHIAQSCNVSSGGTGTGTGAPATAAPATQTAAPALVSSAPASLSVGWIVWAVIAFFALCLLGSLGVALA